jgi:hypothetical protein
VQSAKGAESREQAKRACGSLLVKEKLAEAVFSSGAGPKVMVVSGV